MKKSFFTPDEVTKFKKLYPVTMNTVLCKMFGLSESQLRSRAKYHGVRKTAELIKQAQSLARTGKSIAIIAGSSQQKKQQKKLLIRKRMAYASTQRTASRKSHSTPAARQPCIG